MRGETPNRFRTLFVRTSDTTRDIVSWALKTLRGKAVEASSMIVLFPGAPDSVQITLQPRKRPGDIVSQTVLGACAFFRNRRMPKPALARVERMCQRIFDTTMTIACISDVDLTERAITALARLARQTGALVFDGWSIRDELGRLVVDLKGKLDAEALSPQFAVVSSAAPITAKSKAQEGVTITRLTRGKGFRFAPAYQRHLKYLDLKPQSREGQRRIKELAALFKKLEPRLYLERTENDGDVLAAAKTIARDQVAVINDGWAFYDPAGQVLLDRNGGLDPKGMWPLIG
jgi:hypothetical protein